MNQEHSPHHSPKKYGGVDVEAEVELSVQELYVLRAFRPMGNEGETKDRVRRGARSSSTDVTNTYPDPLGSAAYLASPD